MTILEKIGVEPFLFDGSAPLSAKAFEGATHILSSIPPNVPRSSLPGSFQNWDGYTSVDPVIHAHSDRLNQSLCRSAVSWIGYLSSTGVYGNHDGATVTEETPITLAATDPSYGRVKAEREWLSLQQRANTAPVHIFRLSGIYGPGRSALDSVRQNKARRIINPDTSFAVYTSRISPLYSAHPSTNQHPAVSTMLPMTSLPHTRMLSAMHAKS